MSKKIALYENDYIELTQAFPTTIITPGDESNTYQSSQETDYNKTKPLYINRNAYNFSSRIIHWYTRK